MRLIHVDDLTEPALKDFTSLTDVALRKSLEAANGLYLAESPKVIERAVRAGHTPRAILTSPEWIPSLSDIAKQHPDAPIYVGAEERLQALTGFHLHRGAIASMHRPNPLNPEVLLQSSQTVVVLDGLSDHTNVGAIFRSVAALGADAVLLAPSSADPLYRRAVRVSMGAVLEVPWARLPRWQEAGPLIRDAGFQLIGFGLGEQSEDLQHAVTNLPPRLALMFGAEGPGLSRQALAAATRLVKIPMDRGIDSLNVATAAGIALWAVRSAQSATQGNY